MSFRRKLVRGSMLIFASSVALVPLGILKTVVVARLLDDPDLVGLLGILASLSAIFLTVATLGIPTATTRYFAQLRAGDQDSVRLIRTSFGLCLVLALLSGIAMYALSWFFAVSIYQNEQLIPLIQVGAVYVGVSSLSSVITGALRGLQRMKSLAVLDLIHGGTTVIASLVLILWFGVLGGALALLVTAIMTGLVAVSLITRQAPIESAWLRRPNLESVRQVGAYAIPLFVSGLVVYPALLIAESDLVVQAGFGDYGLYRIGHGLYNLLITVPGILAVPLMPMIAEMRASAPGRVNVVVTQVLKVMLFVVIPISTGIAFASQPLLRILFGETYVGAAEVASVLLFAALFVSLSPVTESLLQASGKTLAILSFDALWALVFVSTSFILVRRVGLTGIAYAFLLAGGVASFAALVYLRKRMGLRIGPLIPLLLLAVSSALVGLWVIETVPRDLSLLLSVPVALLLCFVGLLLLTRGERRLMRESIRDILHFGSPAYRQR